MKKILAIIVILIILGIYTLIIPINKVEASYLEDTYIGKLNESVAYAMTLVDDNMTDHEKAFVFAQYCQEGNMKQEGLMDTDIRKDFLAERLFVEHGASSEEYAEAFRVLCITEGIPCDVLFSYDTNYAFNICYLDGEWTYVDIARDDSSQYKPQSFNGKLFVGADKIGSEKFSGAFYKNGTLNNYYYPEGVDKSLEFDFSENFSRIYYDEYYKYYEKKEADSSQSYIYKENRHTGEKNILTETFSYDNTISGIVKDENKIYYVGNNGNSIYSMGLDGESEVEEFTNTEEGKIISGIFVRDGYIYYVLRDANSIESKEAKLVEWKKLATAISTGTYTVDNEINQYKLNYVQTSKGIVISSWENISTNKISGLYIPDTINELPVIGIGKNAFEEVYNYTRHYLTGEITLPDDLEYIGENAFYGCNEISKINFNERLKSIGNNAFWCCNNLVGTLEMPNTISYIGKQSFASCDYEEIIFSNNLKIISDSAFHNNTHLDDVIVIPEGVVSVGYSAFSSTPVYAAILPSSLINLGDYAFGENKEIVEIAIKSENMESFRRNYNDNYKYYLMSGTQTSNYAETNNIDYEDLRTTKPNSIQFKESNMKLYTNSDDYQLEYTVTPRFFEGYEAIWYSSNEDVLIVNENGIVIPKGIGTAIVEVEINGIKSNCTINVEKPITQTISGTIKGLGDETKDIKIDLIEKETNTIIQSITLKGDSTSYNINEVIKGDYILKVTQNNITREYELSVGDEPVKQNIEIYLRGDINNDGKITIADLNYGLKRLTGIPLTEDEIKRGDITDDGKYTIADLNKMLKYLNKVINEI